ncbi:EthD domain-containing protein [Nemania sp. NC0429]|nr:EthD domain-containing protein [Nemania sp. NC0429]
MPYSALVFVYRKAGTTPEQFKAYYDEIHVPLLLELTGSTFPLAHKRHYIQRQSGQKQDDQDTARNPTTPATVHVGTQEDFDYDVIVELTFEDESAYHTFFGVMRQPENAAKIVADEEMFIDRSRLIIVGVGSTVTTERL